MKAHELNSPKFMQKFANIFLLSISNLIEQKRMNSVIKEWMFLKGR